jgi:hypothetical protein
VYSDTKLVSDYIEKNAESMPLWDVYFPSLRKPYAADAETDMLGFQVNCQQRTRNPHVPGDQLVFSRRSKIASRGAERAGLTENDIRKAEQEFRKRQEAEGRSGGDISDLYFREQRRTPLLIVHLIHVTEPTEDPNESVGELVYGEPVAAWSMSFPSPNGREKSVEYVVNATFMQEQLVLEEMSEDEEMVDELL